MRDDHDCTHDRVEIETDVAPGGATETIRCAECGRTWQWERCLTTLESMDMFKAECRALGHEILRAVGLR